MRLLYAIPIILLPNTAHLPANVALSVSLAALALAALFGNRDPEHLASSGYLMPPLLTLLAAMTIGFLAAHWTDLTGFEHDLREAKVALLYPLLYLAYLRTGQDQAATRQLIALVVFVAVVAGLEAVFQGFSFNLAAFSETERATGPFGPIHMANRAGVFFAMFLPILVAVALQPHQRRSLRFAAFSGAAILAMGILFTYSRQAYLIALFGGMVVLVWRSIPAAILAALFLVATAFLVLPGSVLERVQGTQQSNASGGISLDASTTSRFSIWRGTLDMVRDNPAGVGLGRFNQHIGDYTTYGGMDAHNGFLLTLAELGPLGLFALLWVFWRLWRLARWLYRGTAARAQPTALERGFTMAVICAGLGNLYGSPFYDSLIMSNFWMLCGLMERYGVMKAHDAQVHASHAWESAPPPTTDSAFPAIASALSMRPGRGKGLT